MVKASPLSLDGNGFVLVFLHDITEQEQRACLERTFLHDIKNTIMGLDCTIELMSQGENTDSTRLHDRLRRLSGNLIREVRIQSSLVDDSSSELKAEKSPVSTPRIMHEAGEFISTHPSMKGKTLSIRVPEHPVHLATDLPLLTRVLGNMLINALEATEQGGEVRFWVEEREQAVIFRVWNEASIPEAVAVRIFQRYFTTRPEAGRGVGTFSMKLIGETVLGGKVSFTTSPHDGTVFSFSLPKSA
jgi:signal transduction histidine kinase